MTAVGLTRREIHASFPHIRPILSTIPIEGVIPISGAVVIDGRPADAYDARHAAGSVNIPPGEDAGAVAAALLGPCVPAMALAETPWQAHEVAESLVRAGFHRVLGAVSGSDAERVLIQGAPRRSGAVEVNRLAAEFATGAVLLVDVRDDGEWSTGHVPGSVHIPLEAISRAAHLLPSVPIVTACATGVRAAAAASALRRLGHRNIWRLGGGGVQDLLGRPLGLDLLGAA